MALVRSIVLVDGENLTLRFQAMKDAGRVPQPEVVHKPDAYVWNKRFEREGIYGITSDLIRIGYYTSFVGDESAVDAVRAEIGDLGYGASPGTVDYYGPCRLHPKVFKKPARGNKSRLVDITMTIDAVRHAMNRSIEMLYLFSGDGDFLEVVAEVVRSGQKVCVGALSSGLEPRLKTAGDRFIDLDREFFQP